MKGRSTQALDTAQTELQNAYENITEAASEGSKMKAVGESMLKNLEGIASTCPAGVQEQVKQQVEKISGQAGRHVLSFM